MPQLAEVFGLSEWKMRKRITDLSVPKTGNAHVNGYKLGRVVQAVMAQADGAEEAKEPAPPTTKELLERERLAEIQEQAALRRRQIAPVSTLRDYGTQMANVVRSGLESLTPNISKRVPHLRPDELAHIRAEIAKIADRIADFDIEGPNEGNEGSA